MNTECPAGRVLFAACLAFGVSAHAADPAPVLDAATMKRLFGPQFLQLNTAPPDVLTDDDAKEQLLSDLFGCTARDDVADEFAVADCEKRAAALRATKDPIYLRLEGAADALGYDFKRQGWVVQFADSIQSAHHAYSGDVGVPVWKPSMPDRIERKTCDDGSDSRACYPQQLPQTFKNMTLFVPMPETEARAWRDAEKPDARLSFLVSIRPGAQWTKTYTLWFLPNAQEAKQPQRHRGVLVRVHAMGMTLGARSWAFPEWWAAP